MSERDTNTRSHYKVTLSRFKLRLNAAFNHLSTILLDDVIMTNIEHDFKT